MLPDLRFAFRQIWKSPGFAAVVVVALAVGLGLSTTVFNAFSAVMLRPIPHVVDEDRVVYIDAQIEQAPGSKLGMAAPDFADLRDRARTLEGVAITQVRTYILGDPAQPERVLGSAVSAAMFPMLGVSPILGRHFTPADEKPGAPLVVLLGHDYWRRRFEGDPAVLGRRIPINGQVGEIVGVMPEGWNFQENSELWTLQEAMPGDDKRGSFSHPTYARLRPGVTLAQAQAELTAIARRIADEHPATNRGITFRARPIRDEATEENAVQMRLLLGAVLFVLLIACANVANLLLTRGATRGRELAIRHAMGATRWRLVRLLLTESLVLGVLGGLAGLLVAIWGNQLVLAAIPVELPFWIRFDFDWRVYAFAFGAALVAALLAGSAPALHWSRTTSLDLREGARGGTAGPRVLRLRQGLVVLQVALAFVMLVGAGLMMRSFLNLRSADPGFDPEGVTTFRVGLPQMQFADPADARRFFARLIPRLEEIPGVEAAGAISMLPGHGDDHRPFTIEGEPAPKTLLLSPHASFRVVTPGLLKTLRLRLVEGRDFTAHDDYEKPKVVLVDQRFVQRWFPEGRAVGRRLNLGEYNKTEDWAEIVGVVSSMPPRLDRPYDEGAIYSPQAQQSVFFMSVAVRGAPGPGGDTHAALQGVVLETQPGIPIYYVLSLAEVHRRAYWGNAFFGQLFTAFGAGALFLASLGIYGVIAYSVTQRTQEIGVRMALGAQPGDVMRLVGRHGFELIGAGMIIGFVCALSFARLMERFLYGVTPNDPPTYFALSLVLAAVGFVAAWIPARRATRIAPLEAIRTE